MLYSLSFQIFMLFQIQRTPLHVAGFNGHTEVVKLLIAAGAELNMIDKVSE